MEMVLFKTAVPLFDGWKLTIISTSDLCVPVTNPNKPIAMSITLRMTTILNLPQLFGYRTQISINDGNAMPSTDKHKAPNKLMNNARRGTEIASKTVSKEKEKDQKTDKSH